jgi:Fe-Mn family superoxide dismutase
MERIDRAGIVETGGLRRREVLGALGALGGSALLSLHLGGRNALAQPAPPEARPLASRGEHAVKPLPFDPAKLEGLSAKLLNSHHDNNYAGAVKRLNAIQQQLGALPADAPPYQVGSLKREELVARNSMILHELYFENLGGAGQPGGAAAELLKASYGSLEAWERDFRQTALSLAGGSGWVLAAFDPRSRSLQNWWAGDHTDQLAGGEPVLVLDMYEHAYAMDYGAAAKPYLDAFLRNVLWEEVDRRAQAALSRKGEPR